MRTFGIVVGLLGLLLFVAIAQQAKAPVPTRLPDGWRNWTHITTGVIYSEKHPLFGAFGGVHHIYANAPATKAYRENAKKYPDGSQIVFVLYEAKDENGMYVAGKRKVTALMVKDSKRYARSGGWGWQAWDASGKPIVTDPVQQCQGCHAGSPNRDLVISKWNP
ncbi:MAG: cytochrome P460 family protein [Armatimonadetes bacterium]|nr:cytochrome P460 family protein [Armatimonadota bacterium]CUU35051.1 Cytochrome P460 [Armatimonadetes bacterium DC]